MTVFVGSKEIGCGRRGRLRSSRYILFAVLPKKLVSWLILKTTPSNYVSSSVI
jgi:hypothetical protein